MLERSSESFNTASDGVAGDAELSFMKILEKAGEDFEIFFEKSGISAGFVILDRAPNSCYPIILLTPKDCTMKDLQDCMSKVEDTKYKNMPGICLSDVAFTLEENGDHHPACIALVAGKDIVAGFARQLAYGTPAEPQPQLTAD